MIKTTFGHFLFDVSFEFLVWLHRLKTWGGAGLMTHTASSHSGELSGRTIFILKSTDKVQTYAMFLDGHISEVNKHVVQLTGAGRVLDCAEPAEAKLVPEDRTADRVQLNN